MTSGLFLELFYFRRWLQVYFSNYSISDDDFRFTFTNYSVSGDDFRFTFSNCSITGDDFRFTQMYVGCYSHQSHNTYTARDFELWLTTNWNGMTIWRCVSGCLREGFRYAMLEVNYCTQAKVAVCWDHRSAMWKHHCRSNRPRQGRAPPPSRPNFFILISFWEKFGQNHKLTQPPLGLAPLLWEILDPSLYLVN